MDHRIATLTVVIALLVGCAGSGSPGDDARFAEGREAYQAGDYGEAFERLIVEAEAGNPDAQYTIGYMYFEGQGVSRDEERALRWIQRAAENGSRQAVTALGELAGMGSNRRGDSDEPASTPEPQAGEGAPRLTPDSDDMERQIRDELPAELNDDQ